MFPRRKCNTEQLASGLHHRKHAVTTAGGLLWWRSGRSAAGGTLIGDDLAQVFDAVSGEGVLAEQSGAVADREDSAETFGVAPPMQP
jgi:hypothetical protein